MSALAASEHRAGEVVWFGGIPGEVDSVDGPDALTEFDTGCPDTGCRPKSCQRVFKPLGQSRQGASNYSVRELKREYSPREPIAGLFAGNGLFGGGLMRDGGLDR